MDLAHGYRAKDGMKIKGLGNVGIRLNSDTLLIIKLPHSQVLRIMSRSLFLAIILLTLTSIGLLIGGSSYTVYESNMDFNLPSFKVLPALFHDLVEEGIVRRGHKGLILCSGIGDMATDLEFLNDNGVHLVIKFNLDDKNLFIDDKFDFVFSSSSKSIKSIDRVLNTDGIMITQLDIEPLSLLQQQPNYRIVYLRRFENTIVAMKKSSLSDDLPNSTKISLLCWNTLRARQAALKGLEDALLEPPRGPRRALLKFKNGPRKINFLPDLLGDSLADYPQRMFISDEKNGVEEWFYKNYPSRNQHFEMYNFEVDALVSEGVLGSKVPPAIEISNWLRNNAKQDDFIVMKAEARVVEEMMKEKTICLVDELFLECKNQWQDESNQRAYWQCLTLYGNLRDQGIAVHQWWS